MRFRKLFVSSESIERMARLGRLELPTYRFEVCRSIHLSYRRAVAVYLIYAAGKSRPWQWTRDGQYLGVTGC